METGPRPTGPSRSTLSRELGKLGSLTAREWRAAARTILALHKVDSGAKVEHVAREASVDSRTLRRWSLRLLGLPPSKALQMPGWEWKLEVVLRRFHYVKDAMI